VKRRPVGRWVFIIGVNDEKSELMTAKSIPKVFIHAKLYKHLLILSWRLRVSWTAGYNITLLFEHYFFTLDGYETGNMFQHNLGASIWKPSNLIPGQNGFNSSVFWITISQNLL